MPTIADLNQRHPSWNADRFGDLEALYEGGEKLEARVPRFMPKWDLETDARYELRKKLVHHRNYLAAVIDYFAALLFAGKPVATAQTEDGKDVAKPDDYYADFRADCDGSGKDLELFFKEQLTAAMVQGCAWFGVEHPSDEGRAAENAQEFAERKLGDCELFEIPPGEVYDWECDDDGRFEWALVHSKEAKRASLSGGRSTVTERWTHYLPDRIDVYGISYDAAKPPPPETVVPLIPAEGSPHRFGAVPIFCMELPSALWAANRLKTPQLAHFRASNAQTWSLACSCYAMMLFQVEDPEEFRKATLGAGRGLVLKPEEKASWIAPPGEHFSAQDTEIKAQKDEIFRLAHQMALGVENNAAAIGRSAESKASDSEATRVILEAYGDIVVEAMERVYDVISAVRGDKYEWSIDGLGDFTGADIGGLLASLESIDKIGGIPSVTWNHRMKSQLAETTLPDLDDKTKKTISDEIKASLEKAKADAEAQTQAELDLVTSAKNNANVGDQAGKQGVGGKPNPPPGNGGGRASAAA
jgi:hypothetical protein